MGRPPPHPAGQPVKKFRYEFPPTEAQTIQAEHNKLSKEIPASFVAFERYDRAGVTPSVAVQGGRLESANDGPKRRYWIPVSV